MDPMEIAKAQAAMVRALADSMDRKMQDGEIDTAGDALQFVNTWAEAVEQAMTNMIEYAAKRVEAKG